MSNLFPSPRQALEELLDELALERGDRPDELAQVEHLVANPGLDDARLTDLEHLPFVTVDNADSRDLDQALFICQTDSGFRVDYALADASYYVRPGTPLFDRSLRRGATYYLPDRSIPMLPTALSEGIISLNPHVRRRAIVLRTHLDPDGVVIESEVFRARIRSRSKLSYREVARWIVGGGLDDGLEYAESLRALREVGVRRAKLALARGVVPYQRDEAVIRLTDDGQAVVIGERKRDAAQAWNEQISLLCNTEAARILAAHDALTETVQSVYRVHQPPVSRRLEELKSILDTLVDARGLGDVWRWDGRRESLADYVARLPDDPGSARLRLAVERQVLYTNRASEFSDEIGPHYALAVKPYVRMSSPMREVVGIFTHKELGEGLGWETPGEASRDEELREQVIDAANRSRALQKRIEKQVDLLALDEIFADDLDLAREDRPLRTGTVVGVRSTRLYVLLDDSPLDVKVYVDDLERRYGVAYERDGAVLRSDGDAPTFYLGDELAFVVDHWDKGRRRFVLDVRREP